MSSVNLSWSKADTPEDLWDMLETLGEEYAISESGCGVKIKFQKITGKGVSKCHKIGDSFLVEYCNVATAARGVGNALSGLEADESIVFDTFGIMLDASRNGVMSVEHFKAWLRRLALMGYNMAMLYTEDTYELPGEPYFGYARGAYSMDEIKRLDAYSAKLGIEMIGCIQTLGHLEQIIKWMSAYNKLRDTDRVVMVDNAETYKLIQKMVKFWSEALTSRRIHIGMDETHDLGRGRFMDKFGYESAFELFNRHLTKVNKICGKAGLKPMIWSDMYFRLGNKNMDYYDRNTVIPETVRKKIPANVDLVFWDYYHFDKNIYTDLIAKHRELGFEPLMGSGVWTWAKLWHDVYMTTHAGGACIEACREAGLKEFFFTLWGDDGAYCAFDSAFAGLHWGADLAYGGKGDTEKLEKSFAAIAKASYKAQVRASDMDLRINDNKAYYPHMLIWDDPLFGFNYQVFSKMNRNFALELKKNYDVILADLQVFRHENEAGDINHACLLMETISAKVCMRRKLLAAYKKRDVNVLMRLRDVEIPALIGQYEALTESFRRQWMKCFKPFGFEVIQIRQAGQVARLQELKRRIAELIDGNISDIPELLDHPEIKEPAWALNYRRCATSTWML